MPLFEFRCRDCGSRFEVLISYQQSLGEMRCSTCLSQNVRKLVPLVARRGRSSGDFDDGDMDGMDDSGDLDDDPGDQVSGCSCGGACTCQN